MKRDEEIRLIAEKVMGWEQRGVSIRDVAPIPYWFDPRTKLAWESGRFFNPFDEDDAACQVWDRLRALDILLTVGSCQFGKSNEWRADASPLDRSFGDFTVIASSRRLAICVAALKIARNVKVTVAQMTEVAE